MFSFPLGRGDKCFNIALRYLSWLMPEMGNFILYDEEIRPLEVDLKVLRFFVSYVRLQSNGFFVDNDEEEDIGTGVNNHPHIILPIIEEFVFRIPSDIHSAYLTSGSDGAFIEVKRCRDDIKFFATVINQMCISLFANKGYCPLGHYHRLMDVFYSLDYFLLTHLPQSEAIHDYKRLMFPTKFIESVIGFATVQGVDAMELVDFLTQLKISAGNAVSMIYAKWFDTDRYEPLQKIMPAIADPQLLEAYIHILAASKLSKAEEEEEEDGLEVAKKFIDSLLEILTDLHYFVKPLSLDDQLQKLDRGLRLLSILLVGKQKEFTSLDDKLKDLIRAVAIDAAILIFSLSSHEWNYGLTKESDLAFSHWQRLLEFIFSEAVQIHPPASSSSYSSSSFSKTNEMGYIDFLSLLQHLEEVVSIENDSIALLKDQFHRVKDDLASLKPFLENIAEQRYQNNELQTLWDSVMEVAQRLELAIDSIIYQVINDKPDCPPISLDTITKEINYLKTKVLDCMTNVDTLNQPVQRVTRTSSHMSSQVNASSGAPKFNEVLVGLREEQNTLIDNLTKGSNQLQIFSIVGMPGIGKTTLVNKVYNDPSTLYHFHFRAWCTVSEAYSKQDMLHQIMGDLSKNHDMDEKLMLLYQRLKGKRYLIILDDVWQVDAFNFLQHSFPDDNNGSRLLITSRYHKLCSRFNDHHLPLLTDEDSWELLQTKVFGEQRCPPALEILGKQIAQCCKGLPLTVMIVAGVLAANYEKNFWKDIAESLSFFTEIQKQCRETLELSYKNLPDHLKPCLLYFGAFREDQDISVQSLLRLWISEGFVQDKEAKSLEEVADEYLMNLISRSLVMVSEQRSLGGVKTCRVHDLLHEFCVRKAKKESFLQILHGWNELLVSTTLYKLHRLSLYSKERLPFYNKKRQEVDEWSIYFPHLRFHHLRSLLLFSDEFIHVVGCLVIFQNFKLLRVLDIRTTCPIANTFPERVELLVLLRYLAIPCDLESIPSGIAKLACLETLLINAYGAIKLPNTIWKMKKLRHLNCEFGFIFPTYNLKDSPDLHNLRTCTFYVDCLSSERFHPVVLKFPNIRKLKCISSTAGKPIEIFQVPDSLEPLESLEMLDNLEPLESLGMHGPLPFEFVFPSHLKKLTLKRCHRKWSEISSIGKLPNLQVLKLLSNSFVGETWEVKEGEFPKLKFLKLAFLDICWWTASGDDFPPLQKLVLHNCDKLEGLPSCLGEIPTIDMIEMISCCESTIRSAKQIQEEQIDMGNEGLKLVIH